MNNDQIQEVVDLMEVFYVGMEDHERAATCARDCLLQSIGGKLGVTISAWKRYIREEQSKEPHTDEMRHGAWVPAIPLGT